MRLFKLYPDTTSLTFELLIVGLVIRSRRGMFSQNLGEAAQSDGGGIFIGHRIGQFSVQPLVELHNAG